MRYRHNIQVAAPLILYKRTVCLGLMSFVFLLSCSASFAELPEIKISVDRSSLNQLLSHLHKTTFANTWKEMPFQPTLSLQVDTAEVVTMRHSNGTVDLLLKGDAQLRYYILESEQHVSLGFTAQMQTRPVYTETAILLQVVKAGLALDDPPMPNQIDLFPLEDLVRMTLLPEYVPLLDMRDLQNIRVPLPGKPSITVLPTTPRIRVGNDRLILTMSLQIESSP